METISSRSDVRQGMVKAIDCSLQTSLKSQEYFKIGGREEEEKLYIYK